MLKQAKTSGCKQKKILRCFCEDLSASYTAKILGLNRETVDLYYGLFRDVKIPVFGTLKRDGKVFVTIVRNCSRADLLPVIQGKILEGSTIHSDGWRGYDGLILNGYVHIKTNLCSPKSCHQF